MHDADSLPYLLLLSSSVVCGFERKRRVAGSSSSNHVAFWSREDCRSQRQLFALAVIVLALAATLGAVGSLGGVSTLADTMPASISFCSQASRRKETLTRTLPLRCPPSRCTRCCHLPCSHRLPQRPPRYHGNKTALRLSPPTLLRQP